MNDEQLEEFLASVREAGRIMRQEQAPSRVFISDRPDVGTIRKQTGLPQGQFAGLLGVSVQTLQTWEQGRRQPSGPARILLSMVGDDPELVIQMLGNVAPWPLCASRRFPTRPPGT